MRLFRNTLVAVAGSLAVSLTLVAVAAAGSSPANRCASSKLGSLGKHAKAVSKCFDKLAKKGGAAAEATAASCLSAAVLEIDAAFDSAELKAAGDSYTCYGTIDEMGAGDPGTFESYVQTTLIDTNLLPDKCVSGKIKGAGKLLSSRFNCARKHVRRPDPEALDECYGKAQSKFIKSFNKAEKKGPCVSDTLIDADPTLDAMTADVFDRLLWGAAFIENLTDGAFLDATSVEVLGTFRGAHDIQSIEVSGVPVTLGPGNSFSVTVPLDPADVFNPIVVEVVTTSGEVRRERLTLVVGDGVNTTSVLDGELSPQSLALRIGATGLDQLQPVIAELAGGAFDVSALLGGGGPVIDDECLFELIPGTCFFYGTVNVVEVGFSGFGVGLEPGAGTTEIAATIEDLFVALSLDISDHLAINFNCGLELIADTATITSDMTMSPLASNPLKIDVNQVGDATIDLGGFDYEFTSGICNNEFLGGIINGLAGDIETLVVDGFAGSLNDPDGAGPLDGAIAGGIQEALLEIAISQGIGESLGVDLFAPIFAVNSDVDGLTIEADSSMTNPSVAPGAPDLPASLEILAPLPDWGALTPLGAPYGMGLAIHPSAFNQLMKSQIEAGLLSSEITEFGGVPITVGILSVLVPGIDLGLPTSTPIVVELQPTVAPVMTGAPGPGGELVEFRLGGLRVALTAPTAGVEIIGLVTDVVAGVDLALDASGIGFEIGLPAAEDIALNIVSNPLGLDEELILGLIPTLLPLALPSLGDAFAGLPLPELFGLELAPVEIANVDGSLLVFVDLTLASTTDGIFGAEIIDLSTPDFKDDGVDDVNQWRHRTTIVKNPFQIEAAFKGMLGADAGTTFDDESASATAHYQLVFDIVSDEDWELFLSSSILGAHSLIDEKVALEDAGGSTTISAITASYTIDGGLPVDLSFTPSVTSVVHAISGGEGTSDVEFSGSAIALVPGSGPASVVVDVSFDLDVFSNSNTTFPAAAGDEVAIRFGRNDTIDSGFTAGQYPKGDDAGLNNRDIDADGHFIDAILTIAP